MIISQGMSKLPATEHSGWPFQRHYRLIAVSLAAVVITAAIWFGLPELKVEARLAFITFSLALLGWCFTTINDTYIALVAAIIPSVIGTGAPNEFFEALGDSMIWLLFAAFIIAAAVNASGLSRRLTMAVVTRAHSVNQLFYTLNAAIIATAFVIPSTSGRAALMLPIFIALSTTIGDARITKALALLFPTVILLSAVASLIGAGAHLVTADILLQMTGQRIGFWEWMLWGLPFALVSCFLSTWLILRLFLKKEERRKPLQFSVTQLEKPDDRSDPKAFSRAVLAHPATCMEALVSRQAGMPGATTHRTWASCSAQECYMLILVVALVTLWATEPLHGINNAIVAIVGALFATAPRFGMFSFMEAIKKVEWSLLIFLAATMEISESLIESGGAKWLMDHLFMMLQSGASVSAWFVVSIVTAVSLLSHLLINSRTARSSVLVPLVVMLGLSLGYQPAGLAFISTAAAGFCLTLMVSAKPVSIFGQIETPTYSAQDLLRLSSVLLPVHFILLVVFAFFVWPYLGLEFLPAPSAMQASAVAFTAHRN